MNEYIHRKLFENKLLACFFVCLLSLPLKGYGQDTNWTDYANPTWNKTTVASAADLAALANAVNNGDTFEGKTITLTADIDLSAHMWIPIGFKSFFSGTLEGNNKTISNVNACSEGSYVGLFGILTSTIRNLTIDGFNGKGRVVGAIVGSLNGGSMQNCHTIGSIHIEVTEETGGGLIGKGGYDLSNCTNSATMTIEVNVEGNSFIYVGGITGNPSAYTNNCSNTGDISVIVKKAVNIAVGGISGIFYSSEIRNCKNSGDISINGNSCFTIEAGGITGENYDADVMGCSNTGKITVTGAEYIEVGGVVGVNSSSFYPTETTVYQSYLKNCYNKGQIVAEGATHCRIGGIVGSSMHSPIENSYNTGDIEAIGQTNQEEITLYAGGITGSGGLRECRINNCYNTGNIKSSGSATTQNTILSGGIIGESSANVHMIAVYNVGNVLAETTGDETKTYFGAGGIAGMNDSPSVKNSLALGGTIQINKGDHVGRIVGSKDTYSKLTNCYSSTKTVTQSGNNIIIAPEAKNGIDWYYTMEEPFNQWDNSIWEMSETDLPKLKNLDGQPQLLKSDYAEKDKPLVKYNIKYILENLISNSLPDTATENQPLALTLTPTASYILPQTITISMGGATLEVGTAYTYDAITGKVSIPAVTGDVVIKADGVPGKPLPPAVGDTLTSASLKYLITADEAVGVLKAAEPFQAEYIIPATIEKDGVTYQVTSLEASAFKGLALVSVVIPAGVNKVRDLAFAGCTALKEIQMKGSAPPLLDYSEPQGNINNGHPFDGVNKATCKVTVPRGAASAYAGWAGFTTVVEEGTPQQSNDATLKTLSYRIGNGSKVLIPGFASDQYEYQINLPEKTADDAQITLIGSPNQIAAQLSADSTITLLKGKGDITLRVTAEDGKVIKSYTAHFTVPAPIPAYTVAYTLKNVTASSTPESIKEKDSLELILFPAKNYLLPDIITVTMGDKTLTAVDNYKYNKDTGKLTIPSVTGNLTISVIGVKASTDELPIVPDNPGEELVIGTDNTYTDSQGNTSGFNGEVGYGAESTLIGKLTIDNSSSGSTPASITLNKVIIGDKNSSEASTLITPNTNIMIRLRGENSLGKLVNNGTTSLSSMEGASLVNTVVENNGFFADETASLIKVDGPASLDIRAPEDDEVNQGSSATLTASTKTADNYTLTFTWEEQQTDGDWQQVGTPNTYTPTRQGMRAAGNTVVDRLVVNASETGKYRCVIKNKVGNISTTLTTGVATVTVKSTVDNAVVEGERNIYVQNGTLYIRVYSQTEAQIISLNGLVVRCLRLSAGETRVGGLDHGFYIVKYQNNSTMKVLVR